MATKSVTIKESAYEILKSRKRGGESFSDVIERIARRRPLSDLAEAVSESESSEIADNIKEVRKDIERDFEENTDEVREAVTR